MQVWALLPSGLVLGQCQAGWDELESASAS